MKVTIKSWTEKLQRVHVTKGRKIVSVQRYGQDELGPAGLHWACGGGSTKDVGKFYEALGVAMQAARFMDDMYPDKARRAIELLARCV